MALTDNAKIPAPNPDAQLLKMYNFIGIAMKAGKLAVGENKSEDSLRIGKAVLLLLSNDASENSVRKFTNICAAKNVPILTLSRGRDELGRVLGRREAAAAAVLDTGFAERILKFDRDINGG